MPKAWKKNQVGYKEIIVKIKNRSKTIKYIVLSLCLLIIGFDFSRKKNKFVKGNSVFG